MRKLNIAFAGTPDFAVPTLRKLTTSKHLIKLVITQPDKPAGRGKKITFSPIKQEAIALGLDLHQPEKLATDETIAIFRNLEIDLFIVAAYGQIIPKEILEYPSLKSWNIHASLLPRWRGAAPIQRAIEAGDTHTGISIMIMQEKLDAGPVLLEKSIPIGLQDNSQIIHDQLSKLGADSLLQLLAQEKVLLNQAKKQNTEKVTYAKKLTKEEGLLDFTQSASQLLRKINAFNPYPVAYTFFHNNRLRVWSATIVDNNQTAIPGKILYAGSEGIDVATGSKALRILELQRPGGIRIPTKDYLNSQGKDRIQTGDILGKQ